MMCTGVKCVNLSDSLTVISSVMLTLLLCRCSSRDAEDGLSDDYDRERTTKACD